MGCVGETAADICGRVPTVIKNLEKSWKVKMLIPGPGKVNLENNIFTKVLEKSWKSNIKYNLYVI